MGEELTKNVLFLGMIFRKNYSKWIKEDYFVQFLMKNDEFSNI